MSQIFTLPSDQAAPKFSGILICDQILISVEQFLVAPIPSPNTVMQPRHTVRDVDP